MFIAMYVKRETERKYLERTIREIEDFPVRRKNTFCIIDMCHAHLMKTRYWQLKNVLFTAAFSSANKSIKFIPSIQEFFFITPHVIFIWNVIICDCFAIFYFISLSKIDGKSRHCFSDPVVDLDSEIGGHEFVGCRFLNWYELNSLSPILFCDVLKSG